MPPIRNADRKPTQKSVPPPVRIDDTSFGHTRELFALFGKEKLLDESIGQDVLAFMVKNAPNDRRLLLLILKKLLEK